MLLVGLSAGSDDVEWERGPSSADAPVDCFRASLRAACMTAALMRWCCCLRSEGPGAPADVTSDERLGDWLVTVATYSNEKDVWLSHYSVASRYVPVA